MATLTVSEARAHLRSLLERVKDGEEIVLTQYGQAVAVLIHPSRLRDRRASAVLDAAARRLEELRAARRHPDRGQGLSAARAEELVTEVRAARDRR